MTLRNVLLLPLLGAIAYQAEVPVGPPPPPPRTRLLLGGDVMLSRHVARLARRAGDPAAPFRDLAPALAAADIAFVNLEAPFSDRGPVMERGMIFKTEPDMIAGLELAGVDVVSTANNHARDRGAYGIAYTLDWLRAHGIAAVGTGKTQQEAHAGAVLERNGTRFGFLAYTYDANNGNYPPADAEPRVAAINPEAMRADVAAIRSRADVVVVSMHAGFEYVQEPNQQQREFARAAIDAGATVVVGHHPHVRQPWERYKDGVIFYSLGNLIFDQFQRQETQRGLLGEVIFEGSTLVSARVHEIEIVRTVPHLAGLTPPPRTLPADRAGSGAADPP
jgi:poly-gamma-glutamate capsule biosynthesis protein CapA/YwtB (metallophosphatase superfamily)